MAKKLNVKVKPIGLLDLIAFSKLVDNRAKKLAAGTVTPVEAMPYVNKLASELHPKWQKMVIAEVVEHSANVKSFKLVKADGTKPAYFRAGQYISVSAKVGDSVLTRPYSLSSSPKEALEGFYTLTVKKNDAGYFSPWLFENWKKGTEVTVSGPEGNFYYESLRDAKTVIGIAGGSGITPFYSLAKSIADGAEDCNLILLYGSCRECDIVFHKELDAIAASSNGRVKVVNVLSNEKKEGYEEGFITADLIKKYAPAEYSVFICGPQVMYDFVAKELKKLKLPDKFIRRELFGEIKAIDKVKGYPKEAFGKVFKLTVNTFTGVKTVDARADESLLTALERAGIAAPARCRSGACGFCRSKLIKGELFIPPDTDGRRAADKKFGFAHICSSYPLSDVTVELLKD